MPTIRTDPVLLSLPMFFLVLISASPEAENLIAFKASIEDPMNHLSTWSDASSTRYCNWTGVACAGATLTVTSLTLVNMNLSGEISASICQLPNLTHLNLAGNSFNQLIPLHISECMLLETLNLSRNLIWGPIPDQISQNGSLKLLDLSRNRIEGVIPETIGSLQRLRVLILSGNMLSGGVLHVFGDLTALVVLDLSENPLLADEIPGNVANLEKLERLSLRGSGFHGEIPDSMADLTSLVVLDLSQNNLTGSVPRELGYSLHHLASMDLSQNKLSGEFPKGVCHGRQLVNLSLHANSFTGPIPNSSLGQCSRLERLQLQNNHFSGDFPDGLWSLPEIKLIRAENNGFSGRLPDSISMAGRLEQVQIDNNRFSGEIPRGIGMVKSLYRLSASVNGFHGALPPNFCDSPVMSILNLSHNSLSGDIPAPRKCRKLVSLSLAGNAFVGEIPASVAGLPVLTYLDLSANNLTGSIPQQLQTLKLALFNVSFNRLSGRVPPSLISGLPASFLEGNPGLCGAGLASPCSPDHSARHASLISVAFAILVLIVVLVGFLLIRRSLKRRTRVDVWRSVFFHPLGVTEQELMMEMGEKGGDGLFGKVHIASLQNGESVAVKKLPNSGSRSLKALKSEIKTLAKIRHRNIARVLGFCHSDESILLVYEFIPNGSLGDMIRRTGFELQWSARLKIAIGVAQGLAYLHKHYVPRLFHRNIKPNNILLNENLEPKLTDFALNLVVGEAAFQSILASESAPSSYVAPEVEYSKRATEQTDVYGYGVVLLELVTGWPGEQADSEESLDVVKWVRRKINIADGASRVLDPRMGGSSLQEMLAALQIALQCTSVIPEKRPSMPEVARELLILASKPHLPGPEPSASSEHHSISF